jgi:phosphatidylglycerol:prolipoprotein diacylglycerol transferase
MVPVIRLGPAAIQTSTLAILLALWVGAYLAERAFKRRNLRGDDAWNMVALGVATTLIVARLVYVAQNLSAYADDWLAIFALTPATLDLPLGVLFGALALLGYVQRRHLPMDLVAEAWSNPAFLALAILALGSFLSGDGFGMPTDLPWAISVWGTPRHPVQLYELAGIGLGIVIVARIQTRPGLRAWIALAGYSALRLLVDGVRADTLVLSNGYRVAQIVALIVLLIALWTILRGRQTEESYA